MVRDVLRQGKAVDELHREEGLKTKAPVGSAGLVDLGDARVPQPSQDLRLMIEAADEAIAVQQAQRKHLERDRPPRVRLLRAIDHPHPAATQYAEDRVRTNLLGVAGQGVAVQGCERPAWPIIRVFA